jgi:hypothetical protein
MPRLLNQDEIQARIRDFRGDFTSLTPLQLVRRHVIHGACAVLSDDVYFELRGVVAEHLAVHTNEVLVVGSSKLGFSIAPHKRYRPFGETSDVDVAVVSTRLFDRIWMAVHAYSQRGGYWDTQRDFEKYLFQGWIRPDKLPPSDTFELANKWWQLFRELSASRKYAQIKVSGALYKDWYFLEAYHVKATEGCVDDARTQEIT